MLDVDYRVQIATNDDLDWLIEYDHHVTPEWIKRCLQNNEYLIAKIDNNAVGFLRFSLFWGNIPYMDMIIVLENKRKSGIGTLLFKAWEINMKHRNAQVLMTSSMSDEPEPQNWHRRNGFKESGHLTFGKMQTTPEIFFVKNIE